MQNLEKVFKVLQWLVKVDKLFKSMQTYTKLDRVGPVDNRPSTDKLQHKKNDMWHKTCDTWHKTRDMLLHQVY